MDPVSPHPLVLVVDDDRDTRDLYRIVFESVGYRVAAAAHIHGARTALRGEVPNVVLTDWMLPDGDGLGVCGLLQARSATRHVPILGITGLALDDEQETMARAGGMVSVLQKPADPDTVLQAVGRAVIIDIERRVRAAATRARRYAERIFRSSQDLRAGAENARTAAAALLARVSARSDRTVTLMLADDSAHYVAVSGDSRGLTGYEAGEIEALTVWDLTPPVRSTDGAALWKKFIASGIQEGCYVLRRRDGQPVETRYCAIANIAPGLHVSALAERTEMPASLSAL